MTTNTTMRYGAWLLLAALGACGGGGGGNGGGSTNNPPIFNAADPSQVCPVGYVGWDFATGTNLEDIPQAIKIQTAACVVRESGGDVTTDMKAAAQAACDGRRDCEFAPDCMGEVRTTWMCGDDLTVFSNNQPTASGSSQIACVMAVADGGAPAIAGPTGKACVPKVCPATQRRDAAMNCVADDAKSTISPGRFTTLAMVPTHNVAPVGGGFVENTDYTFKLGGIVTARFNSPKATYVPTEGYGDSQGTIWISDRYARRRPDGSVDETDFIEGFRCEATKMRLTVANTARTMTANGLFTDEVRSFTLARTTRLSKECTDPRVTDNASGDAALRAGLNPSDFSARYAFAGTYAHVSVDMEGTTVIATGNAGATACAVNPPGFYYHPTESYVDRIAYYQQRELGPDKTVVTKVLSSTSAIATHIEVAATGATFRTPELTAKLYGDDASFMTADVSWYLAGDNPHNPYSPQASVPNVANLTGRNLRAALYFHLPSAYDEWWTNETSGARVAVGSVALPPHLHSPSGATAPLTFKVPRAITDRMFSEYQASTPGWLYRNYLSAVVCLVADGLDVSYPRELPAVTYDGTSWSAGIGGACTTPVLIHVSRDYLRRPLSPTAATSDVALTRDTGTGDGNSSSTTSNDSDRTCNGGACTTTRQSGLTTGGVLRKRLFDVTTHVATDDSDSSSTMSANAGAEALGFQIVDVDDAEQQGLAFASDGELAQAQDLRTIEISPNWDLIIGKLRKLTGRSPVEWNKGRYAGVVGIGVGLGYKLPLQIGPVPGLVTISVSAGLSIAVEAGVSFGSNGPDGAPYPCLTATGTGGRCYAAVGEPVTQRDAQSQCAEKGGRLAELHSLADVQNLRSYLNGRAGADQVWLGAQMAYRFSSPACARSPGSGSCPSNTATSFRWLSDDSELGSSTGSAAPTLTSATPEGVTAGPELRGRAPAEGGVVFDGGTGRISSATGDRTLLAVCEFEPASSASFSHFTTGLALGGGAGLGLSYCTPTEDIGVCIEGRVNFIDIGIKPQVEVTTISLYRKDPTTQRPKLYMSSGNTYSHAPVDVSILSGAISATVNFFFGSATWKIVEWPGFSLVSTELYEKNSPYSRTH